MSPKEPIIDKATQLVRENYDRLAHEYARHLSDELMSKPFDRKQLDRFAAEVRLPGEVCDLGCGPGQVARYLRDAGMNVYGVDLSPAMLEEARTLNPDIPFREGDMTALPVPDHALAGIVAFYAIVNTTNESLPLVFREIHRVLKPDGLLLLSFHIGDETLRPNELWGNPVTMDFFLFQPLAIRQHLEAAGFTIDDVLERNPYPPEVEYQSRRAYIFARPKLPF